MTLIVRILILLLLFWLIPRDYILFNEQETYTYLTIKGKKLQSKCNDICFVLDQHAQLDFLYYQLNS